WTGLQSRRQTRRRPRHRRGRRPLRNGHRQVAAPVAARRRRDCPCLPARRPWHRYRPQRIDVIFAGTAMKQMSLAKHASEIHPRRVRSERIKRPGAIVAAWPLNPLAPLAGCAARISLACVLCVGLFPVLELRGADPPADAKAALQALNDFIGNWKGSGGPDKLRPDPKETWSESIAWSWRFKGADGWLQFGITGGKYLSGGEIRYLPEKKAYQLTAVD